MLINLSTCESQLSNLKNGQTKEKIGISVNERKNDITLTKNINTV